MLNNVNTANTVKHKYTDTHWFFQPVLYSKLVKKHLQEFSLEQEIDPFLALIKKIAEKDETAMSDLYDASVNRIYGLAIKIVFSGLVRKESPFAINSILNLHPFILQIFFIKRLIFFLSELAV